MTVWLNKRATWLALALLAGMLVVEMTSAITQSQIIDEAPHIAAGYSYWQTGDFKMNPEHPPLIKMLAALPLQFMTLKPITAFSAWSINPDQWQLGRQFLYENTVSHTQLLFWSRLPIMLLSIILGWIIFKWSKHLFGATGGLLSLLFYVFDPTVIAHARWITTDLGIALGIFATLYFLKRFIAQSSPKNYIFFALIYSLAQIAKFSAVILFPLTILFLIIAWWQRHGQSPIATNNQREFLAPKSFWSIVRFLALLLLGSFMITWAVYGFEMKLPASDPEVAQAFALGKSLGHYDTPTLKFINLITDTGTGVGHFVQRVTETVPLPAYSYFKGFVLLSIHNYWGHMAYLMGHYSNTGWWYYFIVAFLIKTPLVTLAFLVSVLTVLFMRLFRKSDSGPINLVESHAHRYRLRQFCNKLRVSKIDWWIVILTPTAYFIWTLTSKLNLGVRHLLPIYPFIFVGFGVLATLKWSRRWRSLKYIGAGLIVLYMVNSAAIFPHYISYFNESIGGPSQGYKYLVDSNLDWGQDLILLKKYLDKRGLDFIYFHYFGTADPKAYGIEHASPPNNDQIAELTDFHGTIAISLSGLYSQSGEYRWLLDYEPVTTIGYSIRIYDIDFRK
jgi:hypothetical protein